MVYAAKCGKTQAFLGIPKERLFATKLELALKMVKQVQYSGLPFDAVDSDSLYGRKGWFRDQ